MSRLWYTLLPQARLPQYLCLIFLNPFKKYYKYAKRNDKIKQWYPFILKSKYLKKEFGVSYTKPFCCTQPNRKQEWGRANPVHFRGPLEEFLYYIIHWGGSFCSFTAGYICECSFVKCTVIYSTIYLCTLYITEQ